MATTDKLISQKVDRFLGLNNLLNPASNEYREGMAYRAKDVRMDRTGVWVARPKLSTTVAAPSLKAFDQTGWGTGTHFKNLAVQGTDLIIGSLATTESIDVGPNEILYGTRGTGTINRMISDGTDSLLAAPTNPTVTNAPDDDDTPLAAAPPTRQENGTYFYIFTSYNSTYKHESIPAKAYQVDLADASSEPVRMKLTQNGDGDEIRIYRTLRTSATDNIYAPNNKFYFVGVPTSGATFVDRLHDSEIVNNEYEARGSVPPTAIDYLVSWNNRMYYFKDNVVYWSSAGRPQEVAQEFDLDIETTEGGSTESVRCKPKLSIGQYGEAKFEISQLASKTVTGAMERDGRLWVFTNNTVGYLIPTNQLEGVKYKEYRKGIGLVNDKCLVKTPYGIFGADRQGMWHLNNWNELKRITDGNIDLLGGADTTVTQSYVTDSFMLWVPVLNEVWWSMQYAADPTYIQIVYQADRGIFTGPYTHAITGGCNYDSTSGTYAYVTGPYIVDQTTADTTAGYLDFWFGQSSPEAIKDTLEMQMVHSATPGGDVTAKIYQNNIASTSGITSNDKTYSTIVAYCESHSQGKLFKLELTLPSQGAPLALVNYQYQIAGWDWSDRFK
ncbi:MAG: hypothetical protein ACYS6W_01600 [Planctomycetota bacterium]|jgi:hypothetical protein